MPDKVSGILAIESSNRPEEIVPHREGKLVGRKARDGEPQDRLGTHRVDVGNRVRRGDRAEQVRVVDHGGEEVDGLDERTSPVDAKDRRIVVGLVSYQQRPGGRLDRKSREDLSQVILTQLARSPTGCGE